MKRGTKAGFAKIHGNGGISLPAGFVEFVCSVKSAAEAQSENRHPVSPEQGI